MSRNPKFEVGENSSSFVLGKKMKNFFLETNITATRYVSGIFAHLQFKTMQSLIYVLCWF